MLEQFGEIVGFCEDYVTYADTEGYFKKWVNEKLGFEPFTLFG